MPLPYGARGIVNTLAPELVITALGQVFPASGSSRIRFTSSLSDDV